MQKNIYYRTIFQRRNMFKEFVLSFFQWFSSYARLLLEVFIRKNFGERYFRLSSAFTVAGILALLPLVLQKLSSIYTIFVQRPSIRNAEDFEALTNPSLMPQYLGWYIFVVLFVAVSIWHYRDNMRNPTVFDFEKFSLSTGVINPAFHKIKLPFIKTTPRVIECFLEPLLFFIIGFVLYLIGQNLGTLLMVSSFFYAMSYIGAYESGDTFIMDKIDQMICNEELESTFVFDLDEGNTRGFRFRGQRPDSEIMRRKILPFMIEEDEILEAK